MHSNPFSDPELARRLAATRTAMATQDLECAVFSAPESVFYLTGLDHWGYFAPHHLIVPSIGEPLLVTREMERVVVANQLRNARFLPHTDSEPAIARVIETLAASPRARVGIEEDCPGLTAAAGRALREALPELRLIDVTGLSDRLRWVKSGEEIALMRRAAAASDAATAAAIAALHDGAPEAEVAAEALAAMTRAGGTPPGFGPFIRPEARIAEEHTSWGEGAHRAGDRVMLEIAGCVARYNAPMGRLVHLGTIRDEDAAMAETALAAFAALAGALAPGARAKDVYGAWQGVVDGAGLPDYRRHHCGYLVGIGFPPSWTGRNSVTGLRHDSGLVLEKG